MFFQVNSGAYQNQVFANLGRGQRAPHLVSLEWENGSKGSRSASHIIIQLYPQHFMVYASPSPVTV